MGQVSRCPLQENKASKKQKNEQRSEKNKQNLSIFHLPHDSISVQLEDLYIKKVSKSLISLNF